MGNLPGCGRVSQTSEWVFLGRGVRFPVGMNVIPSGNWIARRLYFSFSPSKRVHVRVSFIRPRYLSSSFPFLSFFWISFFSPPFLYSFAQLTPVSCLCFIRFRVAPWLKHPPPTTSLLVSGHPPTRFPPRLSRLLSETEECRKQQEKAQPRYPRSAAPIPPALARFFASLYFLAIAAARAKNRLCFRPFLSLSLSLSRRCTAILPIKFNASTRFHGSKGIYYFRRAKLN